MLLPHSKALSVASSTLPQGLVLSDHSDDLGDVPATADVGLKPGHALEDVKIHVLEQGTGLRRLLYHYILEVGDVLVQVGRGFGPGTP